MNLDNVGTSAGALASDHDPGDDVLVRLMRFHDRDLSAHEQGKVEAALPYHPDWRTALGDIASGTLIAQRAFRSASARNRSMNAKLIPMVRRQPLYRQLLADSGHFRQAAAVLVGLALGVAGMHVIAERDASRSTLRLAGLSAPSSMEDAA